MPEDTIYFSGEFWPPEAEDGESFAIEIERTAGDEIALYMRGISGDDDRGSIFLNAKLAGFLAEQLKDAATADWDGLP